MMNIVARITIILIILTMMMCRDGKIPGLVLRRVVRPLGEMPLAAIAAPT